MIFSYPRQKVAAYVLYNAFCNMHFENLY